MGTLRLGRTGLLPLRLEGPRGQELWLLGRNWITKEMQSPEAKRGEKCPPFCYLHWPGLTRSWLARESGRCSELCLAFCRKSKAEEGDNVDRA